jgi:hypothetical protein
MNIEVLATELTTDPLGRGYSGMGDAAAAADLNTVYRTRIRETIESWEYFEAMDTAEFQALADAAKAYIRDLLAMGTVASTTSSKAVALTLAIFGGGSNTVANLNAVRTENISRAVELGLGVVYEGNVAEARG